ncbi:uncharacterized protein LOC119736049 [Patiria miniata]|uniref:Death domain-containing protein n=1 Tax=Patiria miniata TaxID=46514 RepID=A0A914AQE5_PATMI|nr:uncharacterized protein LOC119736049 [Patiria miniata]
MDGQPQAAVRERDTQDEAGPSRLPGESSINDKTLFIVAERLGPEWVQLALELCITRIQIQTIERVYPQNTIRQGLEMLGTWTLAQPTSIELQKTTLRAALRNIGRADIFCESCINDKILSDVASRLGDGWVTLALQLDFTLTQVKTIETNYPQETKRQGLEMLETWKHDQSISVEQQITTLGAALKNIRRTDIADFLKDFPTLLIKTNAPWKETKTARATGNWDGPRHQVAAIIESCDGVLEQVNQGSVTFVVRIMSREGLDKLWRMYTSGELAKKLTELLITEELTTEDKSIRDIQATIPKNDYDQACGFFDELKNQRKEFPTVSVETDASLKGTETARATGNLRMDIADSNDWEGQDYRRHQVSAVLESCDGVLEQGNPGSGTFVVRIMSREGLDKLWRMYTTGELGKKLTEILITEELTTEDKSDLAIQATIPENYYDQACGFFDELEKDQQKDEEDSSGMMDVEHKELGESSPAKTGYSSDPAEQSAERSAEKLEILHTTTEGAFTFEVMQADTMDTTTEGFTGASITAEEDPIEALTGTVANLKLASRRTLATPVGHFHLSLLCNRSRLTDITADFKRGHLLAYLEEKRMKAERHAIRNLLGVLAYRQENDRQGALDYFNHILSPGEDPDNLNAMANRHFVMSTSRGGIPVAAPDEPDLSTKEGKRAQARRYAEQAFALIDEKNNDAIYYERSSRVLELCNQAMELAGHLVDLDESNDWKYLAGEASYEMLRKTMKTIETHDEACQAMNNAVWSFWTIAEHPSTDVNMKSSAWVHIGVLFSWVSKWNVPIGDVPESLSEFIDDPERCVRKAREIVPDSPQVLNYLARFRSQAGDVEEALRLYEESILLPSTKENFFAYSSRAELCLKEHKRAVSADAPDRRHLDQAKDDLEYILTKHESPLDYAMLADVCLQMAKIPIDSATRQEYLTKALHNCFISENCQRGNERDQLYNVRGRCQCLLGQHRRARESFKLGMRCEKKLGYRWGECGSLLADCEDHHRLGDDY